MRVLLGIDVSTTATKAVLVDERGRIRSVGTAEYPFDTPRPGWSEQDPDLWWRGARDAIGQALAHADDVEVSAVGLAGQMHGLVALDAASRVLRPAILWNDQRTEAQCEWIRGTVGRERLLRVTGNDALPGFTAPKLVWLRDHEPHVWDRIAHVLLPKDYVRLHLTGGLAVDRADGAGTLLFDVAARDWSPEIVEALGVDPGWLPPTAEGPEITGTVSRAAAEATGLPAGTPVVAGGGDQAAAAVGVGAVRPGIVSVSLGTSGVVFATTDGPVSERAPGLHVFCHAVPRRWHVMGVMLSAAGSLRWFRDALAPGVGFPELLAEAEDASAASDGLLFLPYLSGERTPHVDPHARGAFVGLTLRHARPHLTRAVLEGVAFGLRDSLEVMRSVGLPDPTEVRITGGGSRSELWRRIVADVFGVAVVTTSSAEGAAQGAACLAAVGAGWFPTVEEACDAWVEVGEPLAPTTDRAPLESAYGRYRDLYPALRPTFEAIEPSDEPSDEPS